MSITFVRHPKKVKAQGFKFEVASLSPLTDQQALRAVRLFCLTHKLQKKHRGGVIRVMSLADD